MSIDSFDVGGLFGAAQTESPEASAAAASVTVEPVEIPAMQKIHSTMQSLRSSVPSVAQIPEMLKGRRLYTKTRDTLRLVVEHNLPITEAYTIANGKPPCRATVDELRAKVRECGLRAPEMRDLAQQVVKNVLRAKPIKATRTSINKATGLPEEYVERIYPTHTNQLAAASMVMDRVDPVVRQNLNLNANLADVLPFSLDELG